MNNLVYLAGPITGSTFEEATRWREYARRKLAPEAIGISPMRDKEYLNDGKQLTAVIQGVHPLSTNRGILTRDYFDVCRSAVLLINFKEATKVSIGTCCEMAWAWSMHKPMVVVVPTGIHPHDHAFLNEMTNFVVNELDEGITIVRSLIGNLTPYCAVKDCLS